MMITTVLFLLLCLHLTSAGFGDLQADCSVGGKVSFKCPCCPEELDTCRFKKLGQKGYIVHGGMLHVRHPRFQFNEQKTHVTLKECNGGDEGTYMWMCEKCNVIEKFAMKIYYAAQNMTCSIGDEVAFKNPCPDDFKTCTFKKLNGNGNRNVYILRKGGILVNNLSYDLGDQNKVTFKDCKDEYGGIYEWICEDCKVLNKLTVYPGHDHAEKQNYRVSWAGSSPCVWPIAARWIITSNLLILSIMKIFCVP